MCREFNSRLNHYLDRNEAIKCFFDYFRLYAKSICDTWMDFYFIIANLLAIVFVIQFN